VLLVSISNPAMRGSDSLMINFSAVLTSLGNTGPFFGDIGAAGNFSNFSYFSKIIFALNMLIGRLEIFPMLLLFYPKTWLKS
ncbi:MAG: TrkH family potassium uptake protein, partial [Clostridia bacterium]|nr:TrkH family potassium uptake protein [Clostridia bacterium]